MTDTELPYEAVSVSQPKGRALEWMAPLWDAIHDWTRAAYGIPAKVRTIPGEKAAAAVSDSVHTAMRLAIETSRSTPTGETGPIGYVEPVSLERLEICSTEIRMPTAPTPNARHTVPIYVEPVGASAAETEPMVAVRHAVGLPDGSLWSYDHFMTYSTPEAAQAEIDEYEVEGAFVVGLGIIGASAGSGEPETYTLAEVAKMLEAAYLDVKYMRSDEESTCVWTLNWLKAATGSASSHPITPDGETE